MAFRFQKRIKIAPGITINLSKTGVSTSLGTRGARMTFGRGKTRTTLGVPGTGISHTELHDDASGVDREVHIGTIAVIIIIVAIAAYFL